MSMLSNMSLHQLSVLLLCCKTSPMMNGCNHALHRLQAVKYSNIIQTFAALPGGINLPEGLLNRRSQQTLWLSTAMLDLLREV